MSWLNVLYFRLLVQLWEPHIWGTLYQEIALYQRNPRHGLCALVPGQFHMEKPLQYFANERV